MFVYELAHQSGWRRRHRINRMLFYDKKSKTGVVPPDRTWHVALVLTGIIIMDAWALVRWFLCV
jgi:hypothetical protein